MKNSRYIFPIMIAFAIVWFVITWMYISLDIYDVSKIPEGGYKIFNFREKFIELSLIIGMFAFGFSLWSYFFWESAEKEVENLHGFTPKIDKKDNLQIIEWIGPRISELLQNSEITSFKKLRDTSPNELKSILDRGGKQFSLANPTNWSEQAQYALTKKWSDLEKYQEWMRIKK